MLQGFKDFISRGNAVDLAVGVVIGAAFTTVVTALVEKFINPLIGGLFGDLGSSGSADLPAVIGEIAGGM